MSEENGTGIPSVFYRVRDWNILFENNRSREVQNLEWVKMPLRIGSEEWIELLDHPEGMSHLGVFLAVTQLAARCRPRGTLIRFNGAPHTAESIAKAAGLVPSTCRQGVARLTTLGWLEQVSFTQQSVTDGMKVPTSPQAGAVKVPTSPQVGAASRRARGEDQTREKNPPVVPPSGGTDTPNSSERRYRGRRMQSRTAELAQYIYEEHRKREEEKQQNDTSQQNASAH